MSGDCSRPVMSRRLLGILAELSPPEVHCRHASSSLALHVAEFNSSFPTPALVDSTLLPKHHPGWGHLPA